MGVRFRAGLGGMGRVIAVTGALVACLATPATAQQSASMQVTASVIQVPIQQELTDSAVSVVLGDLAHETPIELAGGVLVTLVGEGSAVWPTPRHRHQLEENPLAVVDLSYTAN